MKKLFLMLAAAALMVLTACSEPFITNTGRSAVEQMLLCTVVERGIAKADLTKYKGKVVKVDYRNLATQADVALVKAYTELHLSMQGIQVVQDGGAEKPDYLIQVSCGVLATDIHRFNFGTPELPVPVPDANISIVIPEISLFRRICRSGHARFFFNILTPDGKPVESLIGLNAKASHIDWTILLIPFRSYNVPMEDEVRVGHDYSFMPE